MKACPLQNRKNLIFFLTLFIFFPAINGRNILAENNSRKVVINQADTAEAHRLNVLALSLRKTHPDTAMLLAQKAMKISRQEGDTTGIADVFFTIARIHQARFTFDSARANYHRAEKYYLLTNNFRKLADTYNKIGVTYGIQGNYEAAAENFRKSVQYNEQTNNIVGLGQNYSNLGNVYKYLGNYGKSSEAYLKSVAYARQANDTGQIAASYNHLGILADYQGDYRRALDYYFQAMKLSDIIGDLEQMAAIAGNIGIIYYYQNDFEKALQYQHKQFDFSMQVSDERGMSYAYENIGAIYEKMQKYDSALVNYQRSLDIRVKMTDKKGISYCWYNMADIYFQQGQTQKALEMHLRSLKLREGLGFKLGIAQSCLKIGAAYMKTGKKTEALSCFRRAYNLGEKLGYPEIMEESAKNLSNYYREKHDFQKAYKYLTIFKQMSDSLRDVKNVRKITRMELEYGFNKQQDSIQRVREQEQYKSKIMLKHQRLQKNILIAGLIGILIVVFLISRIYLIRKRADEQKEMLLKEIHHRVKNNLQTISSLLSLQGYSLKDDRVKEAMVESQCRVKSMALIHQALYQHDRLSHIEMEGYFTELVSSLKKAYTSLQAKISTIIRAKDISLDIDVAIPVGMITNELIINAFKHAFAGREQGKITIELKRGVDNGYLLTVADDGVGIPENINPANTGTLGLRLVSLLTRQIKGTLTVRNYQGTVITVTFKDIPKKSG
ncbi:MAG: tetratricopeptide repeat protein [Chlorobi bacterium]|nr:tetratricopeptide repeat protein [Chlorobiota bacterium]